MARILVVGDSPIARELRALIRLDPDLILTSERAYAKFAVTVIDGLANLPTLRAGTRISPAERDVIAHVAMECGDVLVQSGSGSAHEDEIVILASAKDGEESITRLATGIYKGLLTAARVDHDAEAAAPPGAPVTATAPVAPPSVHVDIHLPPPPPRVAWWKRLLGVAMLLLVTAPLAYGQAGGQATIQARDLTTGVIVPNIGDTTNNALRVNVVAGSGGGATGTIGAAVPSTAAPVAVRDNSGNLAYPKLDASGNLLVAVTGAGSGGTSSVDGSGYTAGTSAGTPTMGARDDTGTTACAEDKVCIARLTSTRALMVDGSAVTQPVSAASLPLPTGAATAAKQPALGTAGSSSTDVISVQGIASGTALPISAASLPLPSGAATSAKQDTGNTSLGSIDTKIPALGQALAAASVPVILPAATITTLTPPAAITGFATSTKQSDGSQKTQIVDGSGNVIASTSNNLNVQCANCSGSGASAVDAATFTASTSVFAPGGGFFQTTATSNALTNGQQGMWQLTANRAGFVNLRNAAGTEIGTSTTPVQVTLANTGANATAVKVDNSAVTQPVSGTVSITANSAVNVAQVAGTTTDTNSGSKSAGTQRIVIATDQPQLTNALKVDGSAVTQPVSGTVTANMGTVTADPFGANADAASATGSISAKLRFIASTGIPITGTVTVGSHAVTNAGTFATQSAITAASGAIASGAVASGAFASGSIASGAIASGAVASGAFGSDSASFGVGSTGSAPPAKAVFLSGITSGATGGLLGGITTCDSQAFLDMTTGTTTELVALTASRKIYVCSWLVMANGATTMTFKRGTGTNCGTGTTTISNAWELTAQVGFAMGNGTGVIFDNQNAGDALCVTNSAAVNLHVLVRYAKY